MFKTDKIRIVLVDDHTMVRDALAMMLNQLDDVQIVGSLASGEELLNKISSLTPDIVIMDIIMKGMTGIETT